MHRSPFRSAEGDCNSLRTSNPLLVKRPRKRENSRANFDQLGCAPEPSSFHFPSIRCWDCRAPLLTREHPNGEKEEKIRAFVGGDAYWHRSLGQSPYLLNDNLRVALIREWLQSVLTSQDS